PPIAAPVRPASARIIDVSMRQSPSGQARSKEAQSPLCQTVRLGDERRATLTGEIRPETRISVVCATLTITASLRARTSAAIRNLIAGQGLPFETLCIASCLTAVVVVTGGLAVGHGVFERDPGDLERLQECGCRVAEHLVGVSAAG